jgi:hypothetical protein
LSAGASSDSTGAAEALPTRPRAALATVLGVADNRMWVRWHANSEPAEEETESGAPPRPLYHRTDAWFFSPCHLRRYPNDLTLVRRPTRKQRRSPPSCASCNTIDAFSALVDADYGWDVYCDSAIVQALNATAASLRCSPYNVQCEDAIAVCLPALHEVLLARKKKKKLVISRCSHCS